MSSWIADVATIIFPISNVTIRGVVVYTVADSFAASLWVTNNRVVPAYNIAGTANSWV